MQCDWVKPTQGIQRLSNSLPLLLDTQESCNLLLGRQEKSVSWGTPQIFCNFQFSSICFHLFLSHITGLSVTVTLFCANVKWQHHVPFALRTSSVPMQVPWLVPCWSRGHYLDHRPLNCRWPGGDYPRTTPCILACYMIISIFLGFSFPGNLPLRAAAEELRITNKWGWEIDTQWGRTLGNGRWESMSPYSFPFLPQDWLKR